MDNIPTTSTASITTNDVIINSQIPLPINTSVRELLHHISHCGIDRYISAFASYSPRTGLLSTRLIWATERESPQDLPKQDEDQRKQKKLNPAFYKARGPEKNESDGWAKTGLLIVD